MTHKHLIAGIVSLFFLFIFSFASCNNNDDDDTSSSGQIGIDFFHYADGDHLDYDTLKYTNEAGNTYLVYEIQYFISRLTVYSQGVAHELSGWKNIHYVDTDIPSTQTWDVFDELAPGTYDSLSFTFGMNEADNQSYMFINPPENAMVWPEVLGGGYHYMKLNGKWLDTSNHLRGFAFHLGPGQVYNGSVVDSIIHNDFRVTLHHSFDVSKGNRTRLRLVMNIEEWFKDPYTYDHNAYGGDIMQNQEAMNKACKNGHNVFEIQIPLFLK